LLARALETDGPAVCVTRRDATRWASATFTGARHSITVEAPDDAQFDGWIEALPEATFDLRGHLVADLNVIRVQRGAGMATIEIEALTVEA
jgi:hypothetical protein